MERIISVSEEQLGRLRESQEHTSGEMDRWQLHHRYHHHLINLCEAPYHTFYHVL